MPSTGQRPATDGGPFSLTGWVLDVVPDAAGIAVWFRTAGGETFALRAPFRPSFALAGPGLREPVLRSAAAGWGCGLSRGEATEFFSGRTVRTWTVTVPAPPLLGVTVRKAERAFGPEALFNADVAAEQQFAGATGLFPLSFARVTCACDGTVLSARVLDSPWDPDAPLPVFSAAHVKVQGTGHPAHGRIRPLEFTADATTHVLPWEDGESFLREFQRLVDDADPDLLVTEYGDDFILPRMLALAARFRAPFALGRRPRRLGAGDASVIRRDRARSYLSYGRVVHRAAAHILSGRWHVDARNSFLYAETGLPGLVELARLSGIPLQRLARSSPGTAISAMQVAAALAKGILVPYKKREPEAFKSGLDLVAADKGGLTYLPRPGLHENVGELDFASMYPALMARRNISPETIDCRCCVLTAGHNPAEAPKSRA
jgi:DNA polymerase II